ncbi:transposase [Streptomyces sp. NPDC002793]|uniref:transposase n=1 Tax=Streptomyces sp. NPDC002793 TaxID=3154432 RepID=UPI00331C6FD4
MVFAVDAQGKSAELKNRFFEELDRGGSVPAAAEAAGVNVNTAYGWVRRAGIEMRAAPRTYTGEEKAEFFRLLAERNNVSAVARELGFNRVTCYKWAHKAGIFTHEARRVVPRREEFRRLRAEGLTRAEAAARVGADKRSAQNWDKLLWAWRTRPRATRRPCLGIARGPGPGAGESAAVGRR